MSYPTPQDAEDAFYDAFEEGDLDKMMSAWSSDEGIVCIQPLREPLMGTASVRGTWNEVFRSGASMEVEIHHIQWFESADLAVHTVREHLVFNGDRANAPPPVLATNVYRRDEAGWALVLHHTSPPPPPAGMPPAGGFVPR